MTTYNTYQEAKISNPDSDIYNIDSCEFASKDWIDKNHFGNSFFTKCNPADHCMTIEKFLKCGNKFVNGDIFYNKKHDSVVTVGQLNITEETSNVSQDVDKECYILRAAALENKMNIDNLETQSEEQPKRVKYDFVKINDDVNMFSLEGELCDSKLFLKLDSGEYAPVMSLRVFCRQFLDSNLYRRIETEITERDEFIEMFKSQHDKWIGSNIEYFAEKLFDSGKFNLTSSTSSNYKSLLKKVIKTVCAIEGVDSDWITHDAFYDEPRFTKDEVALIEQLEKEEAN